MRKGAAPQHVKTQHHFPVPPLTQAWAEKCALGLLERLARGWKVFPKSKKTMPENEMEVKPSGLRRTPGHSSCKPHLSTKGPRNVRFVQLRFMKL